MLNEVVKEFDNLTKQEKVKAVERILDDFIKNSDESEKTELMGNVIPKIMGNEMSMMKIMCQQMMAPQIGNPKISSVQRTGSCCTDKNESVFSTVEIKNIFDDWVLQVQEEINNLRNENKGISKEELAKLVKISIESLEYFIKDDVGNEALTGSDFEVIKIEKTNNICPMCEDYAKAQTEKPIVIMSCEGACLRGEISRRAANHICHDLVPDKTVRLCLGGAFTKDGGQRNLVRNAERVIALEGCFIKCASRMIKGVVNEAEPEVIVTDKLFTFDVNIFGINEMTNKEIHDNSFEVAKKIAAQL